MSKVLLALTSVALLGLSGCADTAKKDMAKAWTTAKGALGAAEEAAKKGDSATVLEQAKYSSDQSKLSLGQANYPVLKIGD